MNEQQAGYYYFYFVHELPVAPVFFRAISTSEREAAQSGEVQIDLPGENRKRISGFPGDRLRLSLGL